MYGGRGSTGGQVGGVRSARAHSNAGQGRSGRGGRDTDVGLPKDVAEELWALLTDQGGDADEDLLDAARGFLDRPRRVHGGVVVRFDDRERRMVVRAIDDWDLEFGTLINSAARKLETALS